MVGRMLRIPTEVGDVLILRTEQTFSIHAIEVVTKPANRIVVAKCK
jgi:hypothetical protein